MPISSRYQPAPRFPDLGPEYYDAVTPARFPRHVLRHRNQVWAERVGLGTLDPGEWERHCAAFAPLPDNLREPLALRYHGHQFRSYNPALGDGRGFLFAQVRDADDGRLLDLATKGSGRTPWSRGGDGRLTLRGGVREVLAAAMLEALGVYTSKAFSLYETGEPLYRNDEPSPARSSVLVRLSHSHIRFGTFQRYAYFAQTALLRRLLDFTIEHYFPTLAAQRLDDTPAEFLRQVCARSARLCAGWMIAGFVHGVLNTDNMTVTGESFDYGPYRFLPAYDPAFVAAYFDPSGVYAFGRQPGAVLWNLARLAEALLPLGTRSTLEAALSGFESIYQAALRERFLARLGLASRGAEPDERLLHAALAFLAESGAPYDQFFFDWFGGEHSAARAHAGVSAAHYTGAAFTLFRERLRDYEPTQAERLRDPYFQRPRPCTLLYDELESLWAAITDADDWSAYERKLADIEQMRRALMLG